jgi:hypothetical protein
MLGRSSARAGRATVGALLLTAMGASGAARGADATAPEAPIAPELALTWQAPAGCPSTSDVQTQFARLLGGAARPPSGKHITATIVVRTSASDRWSLDLATILDGAAGHRTLDGDSCGSVASAAALILALMIDPAAAERAVAEPAPPTPSPEPAKPPVAAAPTIEAKAAPRAAAPGPGFVRLFGGGVVALLPTPTLAAGLAAGARRGRLSAELSALVTEQGHAAATTPAGAGGDLRLVVGGARACGVLGGRALVWQACLGGELERLSGAGAGPSVTPHDRAFFMGAGTGGLLVTLPLAARLALALDVDGMLRVYHPAIALDTTNRIFTVPIASAFAALGVVITI